MINKFIDAVRAAKSVRAAEKDATLSVSERGKKKTRVRSWLRAVCLISFLVSSYIILHHQSSLLPFVYVALRERAGERDAVFMYYIYNSSLLLRACGGRNARYDPAAAIPCCVYLYQRASSSQTAFFLCPQRNYNTDALTFYLFGACRTIYLKVVKVALVFLSLALALKFEGQMWRRWLR